PPTAGNRSWPVTWTGPPATDLANHQPRPKPTSTKPAQPCLSAVTLNSPSASECHRLRRFQLCPSRASSLTRASRRPETESEGRPDRFPLRPFSPAREALPQSPLEETVVSRSCTTREFLSCSAVAGPSSSPHNSPDRPS